ncbi:MAG: Glu-tRNA(Gln) amidotransferase subunit GatD [Candidatus Micrarchaeia archaeon]
MSKIDKIIEELGIKVGDRISIDSGTEVIEGELMPRTSVNADDIIVIKLDNGYNTGIAYKDGMSIKKLRNRSGTASFPEAKVQKGDSSMPTISLIYTGGTIGSKIDYKTGGVYMLLKPGELLYEVPELANIANIEVKQLFNVASEDVSYIEWQKMAEEVAKALNSGARGAVLTTGTDTMHYIASALSFMLHGLNAPVVITGAQRSSDRGSSDAFMNLSCSAKLAAYSDIAEVGICMHASSSDDWCSFIRGTKARKMHTTRRDAFKPVNDKPIARVSSKLEIEYMGSYKKIGSSNGPVKALTKFEEKVALVKAYPNSDPGIMEYYASKGFKGIIIEGTGMGHTPVSTPHEKFSWLPAIKNAIDKGIIVGMTSQCLYGRVNKNVYRNLRILSDAGVIYCEDMLPETAYVKLGWLLGNYSKEEASRLLASNIAGEIKERSEYEYFI